MFSAERVIHHPAGSTVFHGVPTLIIEMWGISTYIHLDMDLSKKNTYVASKGIPNNPVVAIFNHVIKSTKGPVMVREPPAISWRAVLKSASHSCVSSWETSAAVVKISRIPPTIRMSSDLGYTDHSPQKQSPDLRVISPKHHLRCEVDLGPHGQNAT